MEFAAAILLFPLILCCLSLGIGLLVERLTGTLLPALLLLPVGFGALIAISQFTTWWGPSAPLTPWVLVALAILGALLSRAQLRERWRSRPRGWWWLPASGVAAYGIVAAPIIFAGRVTFTGYLLDTTGAIQIAGAERLLHHAHDFAAGTSTYGLTLAAYFGNGYPSGGQGALAAVGWLSGQSLIWLYSIFQALELGIAALVLTYIARRAGLGRRSAAVTGAVAAIPALVYAYALMGSIKELTALPMLLLMGAFVVDGRRLYSKAGARAAIPFAIAAAAALDSIGMAASPWVALFGLAAFLGAVSIPRAKELPRLALGGAWLAVCTAIVALPTVGPFSQTLHQAEEVTNANAAAVNDPGNLVRPLKFIQTLGVWLGESHRIEPRYLNQTYILLGVVVACIAIGLVWLLRRRAWGVLAFVAISAIVWAILHSRGTEWTDAKILMLLSPVAALLALLGAFGVMQRQRLEGAVLAVIVVGGILASDALLYHATNLAPTARFQELGSIGRRFAGDGPTLAPDFDEYGMYLLRNMGFYSPGMAQPGPFAYVPGVGHIYGYSYDLDMLELSSIEDFRTIVMRRSPQWSRPPSNFKLTWSGRFYTVWRRDGPSPISHVPLGSGFTPSAVPSCKQMRAIAAQARNVRGLISYAPRPINISAELATAYHTPALAPSTDLKGRVQYSFYGPGRLNGAITVKHAGSYEVWLAGSVDRPMDILIDGRTVGVAARESGDDGNVMHIADISLKRGKHTYELVRGGGDLSPDDNGSSVIDGVVFQAVSAARAPVRTIGPGRWRSLCGRPLDWIEVVHRG